jgi:uncharacterized protein
MKLLALFGLLSLVVTPPACAETPSKADGGKLYLEAVGEVSSVPDMASLSAGVISQAATAKAALASNRKQMNAVFAALKAAGIKDKDMQTSGLNVNPVYAPYKQGVRTGRRITGYRVSNQVRAIVRDLEGLGAAIDALVSAGANSIGGISFGLSDAKSAKDTARKAAIAQLLAKAKLYATSAGVQLGPIMELRERASGGPVPQMKFARMAAVADAAPTPIAAGQVSTRITVSATFAISPAQ